MGDTLQLGLAAHPEKLPHLSDSAALLYPVSRAIAHFRTRMGRVGGAFYTPATTLALTLEWQQWVAVMGQPSVASRARRFPFIVGFEVEHRKGCWGLWEAPLGRANPPLQPVTRQLLRTVWLEPFDALLRGGQENSPCPPVFPSWPALGSRAVGTNETTRRRVCGVR